VAAPLAAGSRSRGRGYPGTTVKIGSVARYCSCAFAIGRDGSATEKDIVHALNAQRLTVAAGWWIDRMPLNLASADAPFIDPS
jgi:hypothetical protein